MNLLFIINKPRLINITIHGLFIIFFSVKLTVIIHIIQNFLIILLIILILILISKYWFVIQI
jgi:hypothetical protein